MLVEVGERRLKVIGEALLERRPDFLISLSTSPTGRTGLHWTGTGSASSSRRSSRRRAIEDGYSRHGSIPLQRRIEQRPGLKFEPIVESLPARFFHCFQAVEDLRSALLSAEQSVGIGFTRDGDLICISAAGSSIWEVPKAGGGMSLINSDLASFLEIMAVSEELISGCEYLDDGADEEMDEDYVQRWVAVSEAIRERIASMDPPSLAAGSYWADFLSDVANGDYG
ncbi:SUKH-4 family immunity protein [Actinomadura graeca]|uniref:SUKH-4 family immunity protein n=1 Tax=Actinomadura graeca TaxID=2750812 RepID=A0ABX8R073_9ACTN|nr:SUKH-4 family immunity protein [Actinomadura graeca]QXJ24410.1 SUKH-4 family immunity protein [Actinomadura graeca]